VLPSCTRLDRKLISVGWNRVSVLRCHHSSLHPSSTQIFCGQGSSPVRTWPTRMYSGSRHAKVFVPRSVSLGVGAVNTAILALAFRLKRNVVPDVGDFSAPNGQLPRERVDTVEETMTPDASSNGADTARPQKDDGVTRALRDRSVALITAFLFLYGVSRSPQAREGDRAEPTCFVRCRGQRSPLQPGCIHSSSRNEEHPPLQPTSRRRIVSLLACDCTAVEP
jgi:hypothetical protein